MSINAYAAGLFDGEGCVAIRRNFRKQTGHISYDLQVQFQMSSKSAIDFLAKHFDGRTAKVSKIYPRRRQMYRIDFFSNKAVYFLESVLPFLTVKKMEAETALEFQRTKGTKRTVMRSAEDLSRHEHYFLRLRELKRNTI